MYHRSTLEILGFAGLVVFIDVVCSASEAQLSRSDGSDCKAELRLGPTTLAPAAPAGYCCVWSNSPILDRLTGSYFHLVYFHPVTHFHPVKFGD